MASKAYVKVITVRSETVVAICDDDLLGKTLNDKDRGISFEVRESFFKGSKMELNRIIPYLERASIANLIGSRVVKKAVEKGFIDPTAVIEIAGIPHAQLVKI